MAVCDLAKQKAAKAVKHSNHHDAARVSERSMYVRTKHTVTYVGLGALH